jgi:hypothetical protein
MGLNLDHRRLDPRNRNDFPHPVQGNIRQADRPAVTFVNEAFERLPRLDQCHPTIVDHLTVLVPRILLVARLKGKRCMDQITVDIVHP